jgi:hypothetical protein
MKDPMKAPSTKNQTPEKLQDPNTNLNTHWILVFGVYLELGSWCLELIDHNLVTETATNNL